MDLNTIDEIKSTYGIVENSYVMYFDKEGELKALGNFEKDPLSNSIRVSIKTKTHELIVSASPTFSLEDKSGVYYNDVEDESFKKMIFNYCAYKNVPGIYLLKISDHLYMDICLDTIEITKVIEAAGDTVAAMPDDENEPLHHITDLFYWSIDTNPKDYLFHTDYSEAYRSVANCVKTLKSAIDHNSTQKVDMLIQYVAKLIDIISRRQFQNGFDSGREQIIGIWKKAGSSKDDNEDVSNEWIPSVEDSIQTEMDIISFMNEKKKADDF